MLRLQAWTQQSCYMMIETGLSFKRILIFILLFLNICVIDRIQILFTFEFLMCVSDPSLMCQRKFPPSFWNSNYYSHGSFYSDFQFPSGHYPTSSIPGFSGFQDPWFSRFSSQSHTFHHRPMHYDFPYSSMSAGRYNSNFGSLLLQSARSGHFTGSDYGKSTDSKFRYPDYRLGTDYPAQNSFPG